MPEYLTVNEIAAQLRVSKMTVYRLVESGEIKGGFRVGRLIRVPTQSVTDYIASQEC